jgi:hypothetical protein
VAAGGDDVAAVAAQVQAGQVFRDAGEAPGGVAELDARMAIVEVEAAAPPVRTVRVGAGSP